MQLLGYCEITHLNIGSERITIAFVVLFETCKKVTICLKMRRNRRIVSELFTEDILDLIHLKSKI